MFVLLQISGVFQIEIFQHCESDFVKYWWFVYKLMPYKGWKVALSPYYALWILGSSKYQNCNKNIQIYLDHTPALWILKMWFVRFLQDDFNLNDQPGSGGNLLKLLCYLWRINQRFQWKRLLKVWKSISEQPLAIWRLEFISKLYTWVPHSLMEQNKLCRVSVTISLLCTKVSILG